MSNLHVKFYIIGIKLLVRLLFMFPSLNSIFPPSFSATLATSRYRTLRRQFVRYRPCLSVGYLDLDGLRSDYRQTDMVREQALDNDRPRHKYEKFYKNKQTLYWFAPGYRAVEQGGAGVSTAWL